MVTTENPYTRMQRSQYERDADLMNQQNHMFHNANPDYWEILVKDTESAFRGKVGLDFGCGCGRNIMNLWMRFGRFDGVDISSGNLRHARENILKCGCPPQRFQLFQVNGVDLRRLRAGEYDFIMSTIVLQHISVHEIRFGYLKEFYRVMKVGGLLSFQMGFGEGYGKAGYFDNHYHATVTNSLHDTMVTDPEQIAGELRGIGFTNVRHVIRPPFSDEHPNWIFVKAEKPAASPRPTVSHSPAARPAVMPAAGTPVIGKKAPATVSSGAAPPTAQEFFSDAGTERRPTTSRPEVFFDVGANNGHTSVAIAKKNPNVRVFAFEPTPRMAAEIESKTAGLKNYMLTRKAVSDHAGKAKFKVAGQGDWGCSSLLEFSERSRTEWPGRTDFVVTEEIEVEVIRLDKFIEENGIETIDFLHIDTQGSDLNVLKGLGKYLSLVKQGAMEAAAKPDILYRGQNTRDESIAFLEANGFEILGVQDNDDQRNEVNIFFKKKLKIKQFIVTYNNEVQINNCLKSIFSRSTEAELSLLEIFIINNHTKIKIDPQYAGRVTVLNNALRPDFSTGHLSRSWNQAIINGFKNLKAPDCDILITNQDDTLFVDNYITKVIELHKKLDLVQFGWGDNFISYTPRAVRTVGLWDERFCNIGYQEADYLTRAMLYLKDKASINDFSHKRMFNPADKAECVIEIIPSGYARGEEYCHASVKFHEHSKFLYEMKWGVDPHLGWDGLNPRDLRLRLPQFIYYPYFEKDVETLDEQKYVHKFPRAGGQAPAGAGAPAVSAPRDNAPVLALFADKTNLADLASAKVSYQAAQFVHLDKHARVYWRDPAAWSKVDRVSGLESGLGAKLDAAIVFDENALLTDELLQRLRWDTDLLLVYVSHDFWCHPLRVAERLRQHKRVLMVLRHECAKRLFDRLLPGVPKVVQRPGVETSIFHPRPGKKEYDVLLGGSETPDYPLRQRLNRLVRENAARFGWKVLDLTAAGLMSNPPGAQREYAATLASSKVSPTASNRGGSRGAKLVTQYFDLSPARAAFDHEFYGLKTPELMTEPLATAGITPRYLESFASQSLLMADLPPQDSQEWYRDKMAVINPEMSDAELVGAIDRWVRNDGEREIICERAWRAVQSGETSEHKAVELLELINQYL
jgi:FkbM family methyltransferase